MTAEVLTVQLKIAAHDGESEALLLTQVKGVLRLQDGLRQMLRGAAQEPCISQLLSPGMNTASKAGIAVIARSFSVGRKLGKTHIRPARHEGVRGESLQRILGLHIDKDCQVTRWNVEILERHSRRVYCCEFQDCSAAFDRGAGRPDEVRLAPDSARPD